MKHCYYAADTENTVPKPKLYGPVITEEPSELTPDPLAVYEVSSDTHVWAAALGAVSKNPEEPVVVSTVFDLITKMGELPAGAIVFFHNLAYDGPLIVTAMERLGMRHSMERDPAPGEYSTIISPEGVWYEVKFNRGREITLHDSYKLLPFSVDRIAKDFGTHAKKLTGTIDYKKHRPLGYIPTATEIEYIKHDVLVMQEALALVEEEFPGYLNGMTIGSNAMKSFITILGDGNYRRGINNFQYNFPKLPVELDAEMRRSYSGGWCYKSDRANGIYTTKAFKKPVLRKSNKIYRHKKKSKIHHIKQKIHIYDVNSLYPYVMHDREYPIGQPVPFSGAEFEQYSSMLYIIQAEVDFELKNNHLPCVQIKHSRFVENEWLAASDGVVTKTFTKPEWELFNEQYDLLYCKIKKGWAFAAGNPFKAYIDHWYEIKKTAANKTQRTIAKLMLNNLYGKFAMKPLRDSGVPELKDDVLTIKLVEDPEKAMQEYLEAKKYGYIPVGAFCTAYARQVTVRAAQLNQERFLYSDTDSIHIIGEAIGIKVDASELGAWKCENAATAARYVRQKTYAEYVDEQDEMPCEPYMIIKACGAPAEVKQRMQYHVGRNGDYWEELTPDKNKRSVMNFLNRFDYGLVEPGKITKRRVKGGSVLVETTFRIAERRA